jgi:hypothetical protein
MELEKVRELLDHIYTDILMFRDNEWEPDYMSCQATIAIVEDLAKELNIEVQDLREETNNN